MNNFSFYESIKLNDGHDHYIFYNEIKKERECKIWALLGLCGKEAEKCYDPFDWCFNPCDKTPNVVTTVDGIVVDRKPDYATGCCYCFLFIMLCGFIYFLYGSIFLWYDLYYNFCKKRKREKEIFNGQSLINVPEDESFWSDYNTSLYTENYWCNNYSYLFNCKKCNYAGKSFKEFLDVNQIVENPVSIVDTQTDIVNA